MIKMAETSVRNAEFFPLKCRILTYINAVNCCIGNALCTISISKYSCKIEMDTLNITLESQWQMKREELQLAGEIDVILR